MSSKTVTEYRRKADPGQLGTVRQVPSPNSQPGNGRRQLDGRGFKTMLHAGNSWLERHKEIVNSLNVFPVPDGDTGTNMVLTMRAACGEIGQSDEADVGPVAQAAAQGALMGARGNSGVILSQILRGMAHAFRNKPMITGDDLAVALKQGSDTAYKGVVKPVEGTILTVIREAASAAQRAALVDEDLEFIFAHTVQAAGEAVERTPQLLPVLAKAGVVDSGGKGLFYILEGMQYGLLGETAQDAAENPPMRTAAPAPALDPFNLPPIRFGFDVQFLIWGTGLDVDSIRRWMVEHGDSVLVEGNSTLVKIHVHHVDPSVPLAYGVQQGFITDVVVENMDAMATTGAVSEDVKDELSIVPTVVAPQVLDSAGDKIGVIAVAPGAGLREVFESLGAGVVVSGGQTMNPSAQEFLQAIEALPVEEVVLLPNNSNVILTTQQAQQLASERMPHKLVRVVPSRTVPQGINALLTFNMQASLDENAAAMTRALAAIDTGEVTTAVRDAQIDDVEVVAGDIIGLLNDTLTTRGETPGEVVVNLLQQMDARQAEIITLYYGEQIDAATAEALGVQIGELYPDQEVEVISGGQPHYHYILSTE